MDPFRYLCFVPVILSCMFLAACERVDLLSFLYVMSSFVFVTFPYGDLCQV